MNKVIPEIIQQHAEEAAFLWLLRDQAVKAPQYSLSDLAELDERVEAHLDGLRIAGEAGWEICEEALEWQEPGEVFAAALLAFESGEEEGIQKVLEVAITSSELSRGFVSALGWLPYEQVAAQIQYPLTAESTVLRRLGIAAFTVHRQDPGDQLSDALSNQDDSLRSRALQAVGELGRKDLLPTLREQFNAKEESCRFSASWSAGLLGDSDAASVLKSFVESDVSYEEEAVKMAVRKMDLSSAIVWQKELAQSRNKIRLAVIAAGAIGDPVIIPWLFEQMAVSEIARVAGEAFTMITGVDIAYDDLEGDWPEGFEAGPTENPEDEDVAMDADEDLPWPNVELIQNWWQSNSSNFQNGTRHLLGKPMTKEWLQQVLFVGKQRQRAAAAIELALLEPGHPLFEVRAPGFRQKQLLNSWYPSSEKLVA